MVSGWLGVYIADDLEAQRKVSCVSQCPEHFPSGEISSGSSGEIRRASRGGKYVAIFILCV